MLTVLSLCDYTGNWSRPYREAGYDVRQVDLQHGDDVRLFEALPYPVRGVLAAPPCTDFAGSGARWWEGKGQKPLLNGLALVDACCRHRMTVLPCAVPRRPVLPRHSSRPTHDPLARRIHR